MAPSAKFLSFFFLLALFFSMQIHARESQFFSKVTNVNNNNDAKETTVLPKKEETTTKQDQEPTFIPETKGGYGLYGHESGQFPPTTQTSVNGAPYTTTPTHVNGVRYAPYTTTPTHVNGASYAPYTTTPTNLPYKNQFEDDESLNKYLSTNDNNDDNNNNNNNNNYYNANDVVDNNNNKYYNYNTNKNSYEANQYGFGDTKLTGRGYTTMGSQDKYNERQGMSDTRFLENGKYYYDVKGENYNPNQYGNSRGTVASRNWYGSNKGYYGNNGNSFEHKNYMAGYENEEEFQGEQEEFHP
jgi:hypothetical protein